jgi:hypothetical protein
MLTTKSKKTLSFLTTLMIAGLMFAEPAHAEPLWDRIRTVTQNLGTVKELLIYGFFLAGLVAVGWGGMEMIKKSKDRGGDDVSWAGIGIKFIAGALLVGLTVTTDTMRETFVGGTASTITNTQ